MITQRQSPHKFTKVSYNSVLTPKVQEPITMLHVTSTCNSCKGKIYFFCTVHSRCCQNKQLLRHRYSKILVMLWVTCVSKMTSQPVHYTGYFSND